MVAGAQPAADGDAGVRRRAVRRLPRAGRPPDAGRSPTPTRGAPGRDAPRRPADRRVRAQRARPRGVGHPGRAGRRRRRPRRGGRGLAALGRAGRGQDGRRRRTARIASIRRSPASASGPARSGRSAARPRGELRAARRRAAGRHRGRLRARRRGRPRARSCPAPSGSATATSASPRDDPVARLSRLPGRQPARRRPSTDGPLYLAAVTDAAAPVRRRSIDWRSGPRRSPAPGAPARGRRRRSGRSARSCACSASPASTAAGRPLAGAAVDRWLPAARDGLGGGIALPFAMALLEYDLEPQQLALDVASPARSTSPSRRSCCASPTGGPSPRPRRRRLAGVAIERIDADRTARRELEDLLGEAPPAVARHDPRPSPTSSGALDEVATLAIGRLRPPPRRGPDRARARRPTARRRHRRPEWQPRDGDAGARRGRARTSTSGEPAPTGSQRALGRLRRVADGVAAERRGYVRLATAIPPLGVPEGAVVAAFERVDLVEADPMAEIVVGGVDPDRALADHAFARRLHRRADTLVVDRTRAARRRAGPRRRRAVRRGDAGRSGPRPPARSGSRWPAADGMRRRSDRRRRLSDLADRRAVGAGADPRRGRGPRGRCSRAHALRFDEPAAARSVGPAADGLAVRGRGRRSARTGGRGRRHAPGRRPTHAVPAAEARGPPPTSRRELADGQRPAGRWRASPPPTPRGRRRPPLATRTASPTAAGARSSARRRPAGRRGALGGDAVAERTEPFDPLGRARALSRGHRAAARAVSRRRPPG